MERETRAELAGAAGPRRPTLKTLNMPVPRNTEDFSFGSDVSETSDLPGSPRPMPPSSAKTDSATSVLDSDDSRRLFASSSPRIASPRQSSDRSSSSISASTSLPVSPPRPSPVQLSHPVSQSEITTQNNVSSEQHMSLSSMAPGGSSTSAAAVDVTGSSTVATTVGNATTVGIGVAEARTQTAGGEGGGGLRPPKQIPFQRSKVPFEKGFSQMGWMKLMRTHPDLAGLKGRPPRRDITMQEVKQHKSAEDSWMVLKGKVYNITPYLDFHPGGREMLMKGAGRDGTFLFNKYHAWVNSDFLMEKCFVGTLDVEAPSTTTTTR